MLRSAILPFFVLAIGASAQYSATYTPGRTPDKSEQGQTGTNKCGTASSPTSNCQNAYINSINDFCLWAPPSNKSNQFGPPAIGNTERIEVAWCMKDGYGTRLIPPDTIKGAHWVQTPDYAQITGFGDLTLMNIPKGDAGGELDPHGADGNGNPIGGLVFGNSFGKMQQYHEWTNFMSEKEFCFRVCPDGKNAAKYCQHIYDTMGCHWNMPGVYDAGFTTCDGDSTPPMGIYGTSTFHQGDPATPPPHDPAPSSKCATSSALIYAAASTTSTTPAPSGSAAASGGGAAGGGGAASGSGSAPSASQSHSGAMSMVHGTSTMSSLLVGAVSMGVAGALAGLTLIL